MLGYGSVTAFITLFKKAPGKSPTQYFASLRQTATRDDKAPATWPRPVDGGARQVKEAARFPPAVSGCQAGSWLV